MSRNNHNINMTNVYDADIHLNGADNDRTKSLRYLGQAVVPY